MFGVSELVLALLAWYFLGPPILLYFRYKIQAQPTVENCDPSELPEEVRETFDKRFAELSTLQFRHFGTLTMPQAVKNLKALFAVYENEQLNVIAVTTAMFLQVNGQWRLKHQFVEIGTRFSDGATIDTTNVNAVLMYPSPQGCVRTQHPELQNIADLFRAHMSMVKYHGNGRSPISDLKTKHNNDVLEYYSENVHEELSRAEVSGYLKFKKLQSEDSGPVEQRHSDNPYRTPAPELIDQGSVFVPTFVGAFKMVWQSLWPIKPILTRIRFARDRKRLAETGYQWP